MNKYTFVIEQWEPLDLTICVIAPNYATARKEFTAIVHDDVKYVENIENFRPLTYLTEVEQLPDAEPKDTELAEENAVVDPRKDFWDGAGRYWVHVGGGKYVFSTHPDGKITPADHVDFADIVRAYGYKPLADRLIASRLGIDLDAKNLPRVWKRFVQPAGVTKVRDSNGDVWKYDASLDWWYHKDWVIISWGRLLEDRGPLTEVLEGGDGDE